MVKRDCVNAPYYLLSEWLVKGFSISNLFLFSMFLEFDEKPGTSIQDTQHRRI